MSDAFTRLAGALADRYRIERELGAGGMATVYLAHDIKHDRKVAIKVLKPELAAVLGAERFVQEIKTTAALSHPHILPLFDSGTADNQLFYVMPYIEGETIREKLNRETQFGVDEAVRITREVADALDYAHRHGVIHRDIKPENILLHDGRPMVMDFGIALAVSAAAGGRMTETGLSLGTPHYMSPEQATADKEITGRSDVYSLASVLYEMLAGQPPHLGGSAQQIIMKIIAEPTQSVTTLRKSVPANVADAVSKALEKLPADRFESAKAFGDALVNPSFHTAATGASLPQRGRGVSRSVFRAVAAVAVVLGMALAWALLRPRPSLPVIRYGLALEKSQELAVGANAPTVAPDGSYLVYLGQGPAQLWIKRRDAYESTVIAGANGAQAFALSPNGETVAFTVGDQIKKVPVAGGAAVVVVSNQVAPTRGVAWLEDGTLVYVRRGGDSLMAVPNGGGEPRVVWQQPGMVLLDPAALPQSRGVLFTQCPNGGCPTQSVWVLDLKSGAAHMVIPSGQHAVYASTGHIVYESSVGGSLFAVPFNLAKLSTSGQAISVGEQVAGNGPAFSLSASGTLSMLASGSAAQKFELVWVDRNGREAPVDTSWTFRLTQVANNHGWALSPDGTRLAIGLSTSAGDDIWVKPIPTGAAYRITFDPASDARPRWTPDGKNITFLSQRAVIGAYQHRADGTGADSLLVPGVIDEALISPDNAWILLRAGAVGSLAGGRDITGIRLGKDSTRVPFLTSPSDEEAIALSPDGQWLAYQSDETGTTEVFVRPFPDVNGGKKQVSSGGGQAPLWSRDGKELFYLAGDNRMMAAKVAPGPKLSVSDPTPLFRVAEELLVPESRFYTPWDIARDGRFIMARVVGGLNAGTARIVITENWIEELKRKLKK
jgi:serine/threonine-protein kinase